MARTINLLAFVGVLYIVGTWGVQWLRAPWSMPALGPTLTGIWEGPLESTSGARYRVYLDLRYQGIQGGVSQSSTLTGQARICNRSGDVFDFVVSGGASRSGESVDLRLTSPDPDRSDLSVALEGSWSGQALTLRPLSDPFAPDGTLRPATDVPPANDQPAFQPAVLNRTDPPSFLIACGRLTG